MSSQDLVVKEQQSGMTALVQQHQRGLSAGANAGAVAIEQERAIAEARGQMQLAKMFPRDENASFDELMRACNNKAFAAVAFYNVPRAGGSVSGPSIRLAEEIARVYGNFEYGHREIGRSEGKSEVEVYAWDKEKNNRSIRQITVMHIRDTKGGGVPLRDQKDIDDKIANVASKQVRGRILALMPKWLVEEAIQACRATLAGNNDEPIADRVLKMQKAFGKFGVTVAMLERYIGHKLAEVTLDELVDLTGVYNAIKEGTPAAEFFAAEVSAEQSEQTAAAIADAAKAGAAAPASAPAQEPAAATSKPRQSRAKAAEPAPAKESQAPAPVEPAAAAEPAAAQASEVSNGDENLGNPVKEDAPAAQETQGATEASAADSDDADDVF